MSSKEHAAHQKIIAGLVQKTSGRQSSGYGECENKGLLAIIVALWEYYDFAPSLAKDQYEETLIMSSQKLLLLN